MRIMDTIRHLQLNMGSKVQGEGGEAGVLHISKVLLFVEMKVSFCAQFLPRIELRIV
jgi:hypothetical protein